MSFISILSVSRRKDSSNVAHAAPFVHAFYHSKRSAAFMSLLQLHHIPAKEQTSVAPGFKWPSWFLASTTSLAHSTLLLAQPGDDSNDLPLIGQRSVCHCTHHSHLSERVQVGRARSRSLVKKRIVQDQIQTCPVPNVQPATRPIEGLAASWTSFNRQNISKHPPASLLGPLFFIKETPSCQAPCLATPEDHSNLPPRQSFAQALSHAQIPQNVGGFETKWKEPDDLISGGSSVLGGQRSQSILLL